MESGRHCAGCGVVLRNDVYGSSCEDCWAGRQSEGGSGLYVLGWGGRLGRLHAVWERAISPSGQCPCGLYPQALVGGWVRAIS